MMSPCSAGIIGFTGSTLMLAYTSPRLWIPQVEFTLLADASSLLLAPWCTISHLQSAIRVSPLL
jgi:hypothetical protein